MLDFAAYILSHCYEEGVYGFKQDLKKARKWFKKVKSKPDYVQLPVAEVKEGILNNRKETAFCDEQKSSSYVLPDNPRTTIKHSYQSTSKTCTWNGNNTFSDNQCNVPLFGVEKNLFPQKFAQRDLFIEGENFHERNDFVKQMDFRGKQSHQLGSGSIATTLSNSNYKASSIQSTRFILRENNVAGSGGLNADQSISPEWQNEIRSTISSDLQLGNYSFFENHHTMKCKVCSRDLKLRNMIGTRCFDCASEEFDRNFSYFEM